jgi:hypothetical protein
MRWKKTAIVPAAFASGVLALSFGGAFTRILRADAAVGVHARSPSFVARDVNHVLSTGQSLSVGICGTSSLTKTQPYRNLMLEPGVMRGGVRSTHFLPLVEGDLLAGTAVPVETMSSAFADLVSRLAGEPRHDLLVSVHGVSGTAYEGLKKGTVAYESGMGQVKAGRDLSRADGKSYVVRAVTNVHGESDHITRNAAYETDLRTWQHDYEEDVRELTGQAEPVPMFITQMSSWTMYETTTSAIPFAQLAAHEDAPGKVILVGPRYHLAYADDGVHLTSAGYRHMGEDYAKAYRRVVLEGRPWEPVRPRRITRAGAVITVDFHVPSPPLVLDTELVSDPGAYGFSFVDDSTAPPAIVRVATLRPDAIAITLASPPTGGHARLRYAFSAPVGAHGGPRSGARGNLRDSDATPSRSGEALYDWCVHFDEPVP